MALEQNGMQLSGGGSWSNGAISHYTGYVESHGAGTKVYLDRVDDNGFRGAFYGDLSLDGDMMVIRGNGKNDPSSPTGNSASYSWTACIHRLSCQ